MKGIRGVFFDLHGTLLLSPDIDAAWEDWLTAFHSCMTDCGLSMSREEFTRHAEDLFEGPAPEPRGEGMSDFERRVMDLGERLGLEIDRGYLRWMVEHVIGVWHRDFYLDPQARDVLEALGSRFRLAMITNWDHAPRIYEILSEHGIDAYFKAVVVSDEAGSSKPDPKIFQVALETTSLRPSEVAYVGDSSEDIEGSLAAGVLPILIRRESSSEEQMETSGAKVGQTYEKSKGLDGVIVIRSLKELIDLF